MSDYNSYDAYHQGLNFTMEFQTPLHIMDAQNCHEGWHMVSDTVCISIYDKSSTASTKLQRWTFGTYEFRLDGKLLQG